MSRTWLYTWKSSVYLFYPWPSSLKPTENCVFCEALCPKAVWTVNLLLTKVLKSNTLLCRDFPLRVLASWPTQIPHSSNVLGGKLAIYFGFQVCLVFCLFLCPLADALCGNKSQILRLLSGFTTGKWSQDKSGSWGFFPPWSCDRQNNASPKMSKS